MNYGTLDTDEETGLRYIIDFESKRKLFKHPNCEICGIARYSFSAAPQPCNHGGKERNDNPEPINMRLL